MKRFSLMLLVFVLFSLPAISQAADLQYASIEELTKNQVTITYTSPSGDSKYICSAKGGECTVQSSGFSILPEEPTSAAFYWSPQNSYAVSEQPLRVFDKYVYRVYRNTDQGLEAVGYVPYFEKTVRLRFSQDESHLFLSAADGTSARVPSENPEDTTVQQIEPQSLGKWVLSPNGRYVAGYKRNASKAESPFSLVVQDLKTGEVVQTLSSNAYQDIAITQDNAFVGFVDVQDGQRLIRVASLGKANEETESVKTEGWIDHLRTSNNTFYFISNGEESPYSYALYSYEPGSDNLSSIQQDVSSEFALRATPQDIFFGIMEGPLRHIARHDTTSGSTDLYDEAEPAEDIREFEFDKRAIELEEGLTGAMVKPYNEEPEKMLLWLHGGPHRQASLGYNPSSVYAVYDELLHAFVRAGWGVLKLDYTGSVGYSAEFMNDISGDIGVTDVKDTEAAIEWLEDNYDKPEVHLMGVSYGGYLGLKTAVESPHEVDTVTSINGVTDWFTDTLIDPTFRSYFGGRPSPETLDAYMDASLIYDLEELRDTPTLIAQSTEDEVVDPVQAALLHRLSERAEVPATYTTIDGAPHILKERKHLNELCDSVSAFLEESQVCRLR